MDKINFENLPSTNTPISAENLNKLQNNIETAISESKNRLEDIEVTNLTGAQATTLIAKRNVLTNRKELIFNIFTKPTNGEWNKILSIPSEYAPATEVQTTAYTGSGNFGAVNISTDGSINIYSAVFGSNIAAEIAWY